MSGKVKTMGEKWTPGPWKWVDCGDFEQLVSESEQDEFGEPVVVADDGSACGEYDNCFRSVHEMRLIAAAPEIYSALKALNAFVMSCYGGDELHSIPPECVDATLVLAKARGQLGVGPTEDDEPK